MNSLSLKIDPELGNREQMTARMAYMLASVGLTYCFKKKLGKVMLNIEPSPTADEGNVAPP